MAVISFNYADVHSISLRAKKRIKQQIAEIFLNEGKILKKLSYVLCSDAFLLKINQDFLQHDFFTDIITFNLSDNLEIVGEVYISVNRVKENAIAQNVSYKNELLRVLFHGALHLCGYNDKKKSEITIMRLKEDYYLRMIEQNL